MGTKSISVMWSRIKTWAQSQLELCNIKILEIVTLIYKHQTKTIWCKKMQNAKVSLIKRQNVFKLRFYEFNFLYETNYQTLKRHQNLYEIWTSIESMIFYRKH